MDYLDKKLDDVLMTNRNISKEILHDFYYDMENGNDTETICYHSLICILETTEKIGLCLV